MNNEFREGLALRVTTGSDRAAVGGLLKASYPALMPAGYEPGVLDAAMPVLTRPNPLLLDSGTFFLVETRDGEAVGCGGWTAERPGKADVVAGLGHIRHFAIHPGHTGRGVGRWLYEACVHQARREGIRRLECYASLNAEGFYAALGFERIRQVDIQLGSRIALPAVWMTRSIR